MARAVQELWPDVKVTIGPVIENGWYYDFDRAEPFTPEDLGEDRGADARRSSPPRDPVPLEVWDRDRAIRHYEALGEPFKVELVEAIPRRRADPHVLARPLAGPLPRPASRQHRPGPGRRLQADVDRRRLLARRLARARCSSASTASPFARAPNSKAYLYRLEEAAKRDHRKLGREMELFHLQEEAPGMVFWHPDGWMICRTLEDYMRRRLRRRRLRGEARRRCWTGCCGRSPATGASTGEHMFIGPRRSRRSTLGEARQRAEADELPLPRPGLQPGPEVLPRPAAAAWPSSAPATATRRTARCTG